MRAPHYFIQGNLVFASGPEDVWAAYKLDGHSYSGLSGAGKVELKERIEAFGYAIETDFQLIRTAREWSIEGYLERAASTVDPRRGHRERFAAHLAQHRELLSQRRVVRPDSYLLVRLAGPLSGADFGTRVGELWRGFSRAVGMADARGLGADDVAELRRAEERVYDRTYDFMPCDRARSDEIAQLIRSPYGRGLGEPAVDPHWRPQALELEADAEGGGRFEPYSHDLLQLHDARVQIGGRGLVCETELGSSHQAMLVVGALPDEAAFPGGDAEILFTPTEVGFPVDIVFSSEFVSNRSAQKLAQRRMVDADQAAKEESAGEHGPSVRTHENTYAARELQARLGGSDRPPLLRSAITIGVGGSDPEELEERVERLRSEFGRIALHRPLGDQHRLFMAAMPAQRFPLAEYKAHLLPEQFGAMVPTAISHAGSDVGPYVGHTLTGSRQPIQLDLAEACRQNRPPTVLLTGTLGSGKTMAMQLLLYQAFLQGSLIVDIDPKGDHQIEQLPGVAERCESIELGPDERYRGLLDPMRIGRTEQREDLTYNFLIAVLPDPVPAEWRTEIRAAVATAGARHRTTGAVLAELDRGSETAQAVGRALAVHLDAGLAKLGCARVGEKVPEVGGSQVISLRIRNLTLPIPGTPRSEFQEDERTSQAVLRLLAAYALRLCAADPRSHAVLALDEAWGLLSDSQGHALVSQLSRMGRSMNITPILASQIVGDAEKLEPLVGTYAAFGVETDAEARAALELLRLEQDDAGLIGRLVGFRSGRCYLRDFEGRVVPMRIDPGEELLGSLDTTPRLEAAAGIAGEREDAGDVALAS